MDANFIEITHRRGEAWAAYVYLRVNETVVRTEKREGGLVVDYAADGRPIGIEITSPRNVTGDQVNELLEALDQPPLTPEELAPLTPAA